MTDSQSLDSANQASESQWTQRRLSVKAAHFGKSQQFLVWIIEAHFLSFFPSFSFLCMGGMCLCVCAHTYVHACMHACVHTDVHVCSHICVCMHTAHVCTCVYIHMCMHALCFCVWVYRRACMCVCAHTYVHACVCVNINLHCSPFSGSGGGVSLNHELFWLV